MSVTVYSLIKLAVVQTAVFCSEQMHIYVLSQSVRLPAKGSVSG